MKVFLLSIPQRFPVPRIKPERSKPLTLLKGKLTANKSAWSDDYHSPLFRGHASETLCIRLDNSFRNSAKEAPPAKVGGFGID